jgi:hypothetical protein
VGKEKSREDEPKLVQTYPSMELHRCVCHTLELIVGQWAVVGKKTRGAVRKGREPDEAEESGSEPGSDDEDEIATEGVESEAVDAEYLAQRALQRAKKIVNHFKRSNLSRDYLRAAQIYLDMPTETLKQVNYINSDNK